MSHTLNLIAEPTHGTIAGYRTGCRTTSACPGTVACLEVHTRYVGDYSFSRRVDAGENPADIIAQETAQAEFTKVRDKVADRKARIGEARTHRAQEARKRRDTGKPPTPRRNGVTDRLGADVARLNAEGMLDRQIADELGETDATIGYVRRKLKIAANPRPRRPRVKVPSVQAQRREMLRQIHGEGKNDRQIGEALGVTRHAAACLRRSMGLPVNPEPRQLGSRKPRRDTIRPEVARLHAEGLTDAEVAERIGRSPWTAGELRRELGLPANRRRTASPIVHGTNSRYNHGCRCDDCTIAHRTYSRDWKARKRRADGIPERTNQETIR